MKQIKLLPTSKFFMMLVILMSLALAASLGVHSQNVIQKGKTFVVASDTIKKDSCTKTEYFYQDKTGKYPISHRTKKRLSGRSLKRLEKIIANIFLK